jgi:hypothetical protein
MKKIFLLILLISTYFLSTAQSSEVTKVDSLPRLATYFGGNKIILVEDQTSGGLFYLYVGGLPVDNINIYSGANSSKWRRVRQVSSGSNAGNTGSGIALMQTTTNNLKRLSPDPAGFVKPDSTTNANSVTLNFDSIRLAKYNQDHPLIVKLQASSPLKTVSGDSLLYVLDSSGAITAGRLNGTGDSIQFKIFGVWVSQIRIPSGAGVNNITALKALNPTTGTVVLTIGNTTVTDGGGTYWLYDAFSTATVDNMTVLLPNSGIGRFLIQIRNKTIRSNQLGIFGDSTDVTVKMRIATTFTAANLYTLHMDAGIYILDPTLFDASSGSSSYAIPLKNNLVITGDSSNTIFQTKVYSGFSKDIFFYYSASIPLHDVSITGIKFRGQQTFANHTFAGGNLIPDTSSRFFHFEYASNIHIEGNSFEAGGTQGAIFYYNTAYVYIRKNTFKNIGGMCISSFYSPSDHTYVDHNLAWGWGYRDRYDGGATAGLAKVRFGDDFFECGGSFNYVNYNILWNKMKTRWFWIEARIYQYNEIIGNELHGEGMNTFGTSMGGDPISNFGGYTMGLKFQHNIEDSIYYDTHTSADTIGGLSKYYASNLIELAGMKYLDFANNSLMSPHFTIGRYMKDCYIHDNTFRSPNSITTGESGAAILFNIGTSTGASGTDSIINLNIYKNHIFMQDGEIIRTNSQVTTGLKLYENDFHWTGSNSMIIGEIYPSGTNVAPEVSIRSNTFEGTVFSAFYAENTGSGQQIDLRNNDFTKTNIDPTSNMVTDFHVASKINKIGSTFSTGVFNFSYATKTSAYTITPFDDVIIADATSGAVTITLPSAVGSNKQYTIKRINSGANNVTIALTGGQSLDGNTSGLNLTTQYQSMTVFSNGTNWLTR